MEENIFLHTNQPLHTSFLVFIDIICAKPAWRYLLAFQQLPLPPPPPLHFCVITIYFFDLFIPSYHFSLPAAHYFSHPQQFQIFQLTIQGVMYM